MNVMFKKCNYNTTPHVRGSKSDTIVLITLLLADPPGYNNINREKMTE